MVGDVIALGGGFTATILWENANPSTTIGAFTVSDLPNMTRFVCIGIENNSDITNSNSGCKTDFVFPDGDTYCLFCGSAASGGGGTRYATVNSTSIAFTNGKWNGSNNSEVCVPTAILGIK